MVAVVVVLLGRLVDPLLDALVVGHIPGRSGLPLNVGHARNVPPIR